MLSKHLVALCLALLAFCALSAAQAFTADFELRRPGQALQNGVFFLSPSIFFLLSLSLFFSCPTFH